MARRCAIAAILVVSLTGTLATECTESNNNEYCSCCCYTTISPELVLLAPELNLYACTHYNYGLLPCCNPNADSEPPLPPMVNSYEPTHAPTQAPATSEPTQAPATSEPSPAVVIVTTSTPAATTTVDQDRVIYTPQVIDSTNTPRVIDSTTTEPTTHEQGADRNGGNDRNGENGHFDPLHGKGKGMKGEKGSGMKGFKGEKGSKLGKMSNRNEGAANQGVGAAAVGLCAAAFSFVAVGAVLTVKRRNAAIKEAAQPLLSEPRHGQPVVYNRTFMGIFGDISQDPTAGSVLMADKTEPKASFSPPRRFVGYPNSGHVAIDEGRSPTHPGIEAMPFQPSVGSTPHPGSELLHRLSPNRKAARDTLHSLGLAPVLDDAAGVKRSKPGWFSSLRPASGHTVPSARVPTAKTGLLAGNPSKEFVALGLAPRMD